MAEAFIPHFETFDTAHPKNAFAQKMMNLQKVIFSRTLDKPFGKNTSLTTGNLADEIAKLKINPERIFWCTVVPVLLTSTEAVDTLMSFHICKPGADK